MLIYTSLKLLSDTNKNICDISDILLYSEVTNFMRDFRLLLHICINEARQQLVFMSSKELFDCSWIGHYIKMSSFSEFFISKVHLLI